MPRVNRQISIRKEGEGVMVVCMNHYDNRSNEEEILYSSNSTWGVVVFWAWLIAVGHEGRNWGHNVDVNVAKLKKRRSG